LAVKWFMPEDLMVGVGYHHAPIRDPFRQLLSSLAHLADHLVRSAGDPSTAGAPPPRLDFEVYDQVGLEAQQVKELLPQIREDCVGTELAWAS
jgi:hypothetical protein